MGVAALTPARDAPPAAWNEMLIDKHPQLLATKIIPPRQGAGLIERPRLLGLIAQLQTRKLALIRAAAGFGKTSLAVAWAERLRWCGNRVAWLSLDGDDDEPTRFLFYVAHVLRSACGDVGEPAIDLIRETFLVRPHAIITTLINGLADIDDEVCLFLDDYHLMTHRGIHDAVGDLLRNAPSNFHLVIATRSEPPLPLARLRAQNQLLEIDGAALRFDLDETRQFIEHENLGTLEPAGLTALNARTEGWPAVLRIVAATSSQSGQDLGQYVRGLSGALRPIGAYFAEMLDGLPSEIVQFMVRTAILDHLTIPLCQAVTGNGSSRDVLEFMAVRQLLVSVVDRDARSYSYHALLRDYLNQRLAAELLEEIPELHRRVARWHATHEQWTEAIQHALAAGDKDQAIAWIETCAMQLVKRGDLIPLLGWQRLLPAELMRSQIKVRLAIAWGLSLAMRFDDALQFVVEIERDLVGEDTPNIGPLKRECQTIRSVALALQDDSQAALPLAEGCLRGSADPWTANVASNVARFSYWRAGNLEEFHAAPWIHFCDDQDRRNLFASVYRLCLQGLVEVQQVRFSVAERYYQGALRIAENHCGRDSVASALPASLMAQIRYEQGSLDEAEAMVIDRMPIIDATGMLDCVLRARLVLARVAASRLNFERAHALLDQAEVLGSARGWGRLSAAALLERMRLHIDGGRMAEGRACLIHIERIARDHPAPTRCAWSDIHSYAALARCLLMSAEKRPLETIDILRSLHREAVLANNHYHALRLATQLSVSLLDANQIAEALTVFQRVLSTAQSAAICQTVIDQGPRIGALLSRIRESAQRPGLSGRFPSYVDDLLTRWRDRYKPESTRDMASPIVGALSPRERGVLELIGRGQSNKDIARMLGIAPETVKSHVKSIFLKLGVERRAQAISRAQSLGLVVTT